MPKGSPEVLERSQDGSGKVIRRTHKIGSEEPLGKGPYGAPGGPPMGPPGGALSLGLLGPYFLGPSDDLPGSILGPFQDLRATFGHLLVAPAWPIQAFSGTFR